MYNVTSRISSINQPAGGYIPISRMKKEQFDDGIILHANGNLPRNIIGLTVDYIFRYLSTGDKRKAFIVSLRGAEIAQENDIAEQLLSSITGTDEVSIISACKLVTYDFWFRNGVPYYIESNQLSVDKESVKVIQTLLQRSLHFLDQYGPITKTSLVFKGAYTPIIRSGDADFMTEDTIWDMKVSDKRINNKQSLQVLIYYLLGMHSEEKESYKSIKKIGLFNPFRNQTYTFELDQVPEKTMTEICSAVIGYGWRLDEYIEYYKRHNIPFIDDERWHKHEDPSSQINHLALVQKIDKEFIDYFGTDAKRIETLFMNSFRRSEKEKIADYSKEYNEGTIIETKKWGRGIISDIHVVGNVLYCSIVFLNNNKCRQLQLSEVKRIDLLNPLRMRTGSIENFRKPE